LQNVRPLIAISNTFVNPIVAFIMGITFAGDMITGSEYMALAVILVGVLLVLTANAIETKK
jgi:EamA domain-containing membrane protein RarD